MRKRGKLSAPLEELRRLKSGEAFEGTLTWVPERVTDFERMREGVAELLGGMGVDANDPNFLETPQRVARMFAEFMAPKAMEWKTFPARSADLVLLRGHRAVGLCPHHLQPVEYTCAVGYIPHEKTVGLSKLARAVDAQLSKPMLHEDLADAVADSIERALRPIGVGVVLAGVHGCMRFRGVRSLGDVVVSVMRGTLLVNSSARAEFMQVVGRP